MVKYRSFVKKYHTKKPTKLANIINSPKWTIIDIRPSFEWDVSHIINSINIPHYSFKELAFRKLKRTQKILLISQTGRSHLDLYQWLKKYEFKVFILEGGWKAIHLKDEYDALVTFKPD